MRYTGASARRAELVRRLTADGYVSSAGLALELGVSEMTIRRDLRQLDLDGIARRVTGGASLPAGGGEPFDQRDRASTGEKRSIAAACAELLADATTLALDAGTTVAPLAGLVAKGATVVTHSLPVISTCAARDDVELVALGGTYQWDTRSFTGPATEAGLASLSVDAAVLSATAVDSSGLLCANALDASIKQRMADVAVTTILLVDHRKIGARAPIRFGRLDLVDVVVTDSAVTADQQRLLRSGGARLVVAP
ncbi:DeoR/GlpR transcriptional regulator [Kribbella turkmenica]|uniref:Lactose phosphotransferase system repressor n=1 Tax=Kribbella turkmenica TaxID=2530375 RepID=A0A4R4WQ98_9ACTN|nr:DeoR/GlpR transcriptional regulator [Kribbella turkmenica]